MLALGTPEASGLPSEEGMVPLSSDTQALCVCLVSFGNLTSQASGDLSNHDV